MTRRFLRKEAIMARKSALIVIAAALSACQHTPEDLPDRGVEAVNAPVVTRSDYSLDVAAPDGSLPGSEAARLDAWFRSLQLGYGDSIYVDGDYSGAARADVARIAGRYGMMVSAGSPVTAGNVQPGTVRVVVSRTRATASFRRPVVWVTADLAVEVATYLLLLRRTLRGRGLLRGRLLRRRLLR